VQLAELPPALKRAGERLGYGEMSSPVQTEQGWLILQRMPRDFRFQAEAKQDEAEDLAKNGDLLHAIETSQQALRIYPAFLRAITFIGLSFAQSGNTQKAAQVLSTACRLYPNDAPVAFTYGTVLSLAGDKNAAAHELQRAISLQPDFTAAYVSLGKEHIDAGRWRDAIVTLRQGLQIDPLSAELYSGLSIALSKTGDQEGADQARKLAQKLGP
jgi:Flp pilus assembly protein TadD